jgi:hypothetical protein
LQQFLKFLEAVWLVGEAEKVQQLSKSAYLKIAIFVLLTILKVFPVPLISKTLNSILNIINV